MNETIKGLWSRKSCRAFLDEPLKDEEKQCILEASLQAPSAGNMCLYEIMEIRDPALKEILSRRCDNQPFIAKAPFVLLYLASYRRYVDAFAHYGLKDISLGVADLMLAMEDTLIAAQNAVVAAWSMGIGSCYIGDILENYEANRELLQLPDYVVPVSLVVFGYPAKSQLKRQKPQRLDLSDILHVDHYETKTPEDLEAMLGKLYPDVKGYVVSLAKRKMQAAFHQEMNRSCEAIIQAWKEGEDHLETD